MNLSLNNQSYIFFSYNERMLQKSIIGILLTVLISMTNFGLFIPDIQLRGATIGGTGIQIGIMIASFSFSQAIFSPLLGRLSDRIGRKPVMLFTLIVGVLSNYFYTSADTILQMMLCRFLSGIAASNLSIAYSIIADLTTLQERTRYVGLVGAMMGMGFIIGAPLGALLVEYGQGKAIFLGFTAAGLNLINFLFVAFTLKESRQVDTESIKPSIKKAFQHSDLAPLLLLLFSSTFAMANLESTFMQLTILVHKINQIHAAFILCFIGVTSAWVQGGLLKKVLVYMDEVSLLKIGYALIIPSIVILPYCMPYVPLLGCLLILGVGRGLADPCINGLISKHAPPDLRGSTFGITQSVGAIARIISPLIANTLFAINPAYPYAFAGLILLGVLVKGYNISSNLGTN